MPGKRASPVLRGGRRSNAPPLPDHYEAADRDRLVSAAQEAFDAISTACYEPTSGQAVELWQDVLGTSFKAAA